MKNKSASKRRNLARRISALFASGAFLAFGFTPEAYAQRYWDGNDNAAGFGAASGTWAVPTAGTTTAGWSASAAGTDVVDSTNYTTLITDTLNFGNGATGLGAGTIAVSGTVDAANLTFASGTGAIELSGGTINLAAAATITVNNATDTIGSVLSGAGTSLTKNGTGILVVSGANTYAGNTLITAGTLQIDGSRVVPGTGTTSQLQVGFGSGTNGNLIIGSGAGTVTFGGNGYANAAQIGGNGGTGTLTINGGIVNLIGTTGTGATTLHIGVQVAGTGGTGTVTVNGGTLNIGQRILMGANNAVTNGTLTIAGGTVNVGTNGTLGYTGNDPGSVQFGIGTAAVNLDGGTLKLFGFKSSVVGNTINFNGGTVTALGNQGFFIGNNGASDAAPNAVGLITAKVKAGGAIFDTNNFNITIGSALVVDPMSTGGGLTKLNTGTLTLSGASTYTGATAIKNGTLALGGGNDRLPAGTTVTLGDGITNTNGIFRLDSRSQQLAGLLTAGTGTGNRVVNGNATAATLMLNIAAGTNIFGGILGGTGTNENNFALTKSDIGTLTLTGANTYTGATNINAGNLIISGSGVIANNASNTITIGNGGTLTMDRTDTWGASGGAGNPVIPIVISAGGIMTNSGNRFNTLGPLTLNGGTLTTTGGAIPQFPSWALRGTVTVGGSVPSTISNGSGTNPAINLGANSVTGTTFDVADSTGNPSTDLTVTALLQNGSNSGNAVQASFLTKTGVGTMTLAAANTYTGTTTITSGTLALTGTGTLGTGNVIVNGILDIAGISPASYTLGTAQVLSGDGTINATGKTLNVNGTLAPGNSPGSLDVTGNVVLAGTTTANFEIDGPSSNDLLAVTGSLTYAGALNINTTQTAGSFDLFNFGSLGVGDFSSITLSNALSFPLASDGLGNWTGNNGSVSAIFTGSTGVLEFAVIPEPSTLVLGGLALLGFAGVGLRRRRMAQPK